MRGQSPWLGFAAVSRVPAACRTRTGRARRVSGRGPSRRTSETSAPQGGGTDVRGRGRVPAADRVDKPSVPWCRDGPDEGTVTVVGVRGPNVCRAPPTRVKTYVRGRIACAGSDRDTSGVRWCRDGRDEDSHRRARCAGQVRALAGFCVRASVVPLLRGEAVRSRPYRVARPGDGWRAGRPLIPIWPGWWTLPGGGACATDGTGGAGSRPERPPPP
jgi:hypothetical protein